MEIGSKIFPSVSRSYSNRDTRYGEICTRFYQFASDFDPGMQVLPLRFISRRWGEITSIELPQWLRPIVYSGWARAFHSNLEEASRPIEEYPSLRAFFTRKLKDGARPLEVGPSNLISPVDGVVTAFGQVMGSSTMIEQVAC